MTLGTRTGWRRMGIADRLLSALLEHLRGKGAGPVRLHCTVDNHAAVALYKRYDFRVEEHIRSHYYFHDQWHDALSLELAPRRIGVASMCAFLCSCR